MSGNGALVTGLRHQKFVDEFFRDFDVHRAYEEAGYNGSTGPSRLVQIAKLVVNGDVRARMEAQLDRIRTEVYLDHVQHAEEVCALAYSSLRDVCSWGPDGVQVIPSDELPPAVARTVQKVTSTVSPTGEVRVEVALHNKVESLKLLWTMFDRVRAAQREMEKQVDLLAKVAAAYVPAERYADYCRDVADATAGRISTFGADAAASATDVTPAG